MFQPKVLSPSPDPWFVRELRRIDPNLRIVWAYERYLKSSWAIERKFSPERYFAMHASLLENDGPRFVEQPIFDTNSPIYDEYGDFVAYEQIGTRRYDLAPEWEWISFIDAQDARAITDLKRAYAWHYNHSATRERIERQIEEERRVAARKAATVDVGLAALDEAYRIQGLRVQDNNQGKVREGTEI